jgi:hypothetical protein
MRTAPGGLSQWARGYGYKGILWRCYRLQPGHGCGAGSKGFTGKERAMKKFVVPVVLLVLAGCSNPIKDDLLAYINTELPKVAAYEADAIAAYESVSGNNYTDDYTMYDTLTETVIPSYRELVSGIEAITLRLKTKEVRGLNEKYIEAADSQMNGFIILMNALETQDGSLIVQFNERLDKGRRLTREWQIELQDLCNKNGVKFQTQ